MADLLDPIAIEYVGKKYKLGITLVPFHFIRLKIISSMLSG